MRELMGGKSGIAFSYRIVGRRKDVRGHRRFAKFDMRLPLPASQARKPSSAAGLRAFVSRVEREARRRRPKVAKKGRRSRGLPKYLELTRHMRPRAAQKGLRQCASGCKITRQKGSLSVMRRIAVRCLLSGAKRITVARC